MAQSTTHATTLPVELWQLVIDQLDLSCLLNIRLLSRSFKHIVESHKGNCAPILHIQYSTCLSATLSAINSKIAVGWAKYLGLIPIKNHTGRTWNDLDLFSTSMAYNYRNITRQSIWVLHDTVHHAALVVHAFMLIPALPVITTVQISANTSLNKHQILHDTPPVQDRCMALQIKATSFFSYDTPTGLALMVDGVGAQMGDCTSMYKAEATQLKNSLQHDPSAVYPVFVTRLLTSMYETADYGDDPRLRMVIAAGTSTSHRHLMRSLSPPQSHPSPSSSHLVELWYRGGSTGAFLMEQYRLINQGKSITATSAFKRERVFTLKSENTEAGLTNYIEGLNGIMRALSEYWTLMAAFCIGEGISSPHTNLAGRLQSDS